MASAIVAAGKKRRNEIAPPGPNLSTKAGRVAAAILRAGRIRRGELIAPSPRTRADGGIERSDDAKRVADEIIKAGKKRRGEPVDDEHDAEIVETKGADSERLD